MLRKISQSSSFLPTIQSRTVAFVFSIHVSSSITNLLNSQNLSSLQDKRAACANDYFQSRGKAELEMGSDARPHKIQLDYEELKISPQKAVRNDISIDRLTSNSTEIPIQRINETNAGADSNLPKFEPHRFNGSISHDAPVTIDTPQRLLHPTTKRQPPDSKMDDSSGDDAPEVALNTKCYKKEFPRKKARSVPEDGGPIETVCDRSMRKVTIKSKSSDCDFVTSTVAGHCSSFHPENNFQNNNHVKEADIRTQSNQINHNFPIIFPTQQRRQSALYINDEQGMVGEVVPQTPTLAFTVTDKEGYGIELTIAVYGMSSTRSNTNGSRSGNPLHLLGRWNGFQETRNRRYLPSEVRYENFAACGELYFYKLHALSF